MSTTYAWKVVEIGTKDTVNNDNDVLTDAIVSVTWKKTGTDISGNVATYVGTTNLDPSGTAAADFIATDDVTSSNIIDWLEAVISDEQMAKIDAAIARKIEKNQISKRAFTG